VTWLAERKPDIVCLLETKCVDDAFPRKGLRGDLEPAVKGAVHEIARLIFGGYLEQRIPTR
jgi:exonuclease III